MRASVIVIVDDTTDEKAIALKKAVAEAAKKVDPKAHVEINMSES